jgi:DNA-directed RNA polymerase sigma subunit (sigma70/sigma32)
LKEIGAMFGISRERVRQLEARAMAKLRERLDPLRAA